MVVSVVIHHFRSNAWEEPSLLLMLRLISISLFLADLIIVKFVLPILIDNLLISHHFLTFASSEFFKCSSDFKSLAEAKILVSSAKISKHNFLSNLDNGSGFPSEEFVDFMARNEILHVKTAHRHPSSNDLVERSVRIFREGMKKVEGFGGTVHTRLSRFL